MNDRIGFHPNEITKALDPGKRLESFYELLLEENSRVNLVSRETEPTDLIKLAAESLLPLTTIDRSFGSYLDIGAGGGFPAIPIMLSGRISGSTLLMERIGKKAEALKRITKALDLKAEIVAENFPFGQVKTKFDLITLRWVKLEQPLLRKIMARLAPGGFLIHYSSEAIADENSKAETTLFEDSQAGVEKGFTLYQQA